MAITAEVRKKLKEMNKAWKTGKDSVSGVPAGVYHMRLQGATVKLTSNKKLTVIREHLIVDGEFEGTVVTDFMNLEGEMGAYFAAQFIDQLGYEIPEEPTEIPETIEAVVADAPEYIASVVHSEGFTNVRFKELVESFGEAVVEEAETSKKVNDNNTETSDLDLWRDAKLEELKVFCEAIDVELPDDATVDDIAEILKKGYDLSKEDYLPEEVELLESIGFEFME